MCKIYEMCTVIVDDKSPSRTYKSSTGTKFLITKFVNTKFLITSS
jgi:hypothetical protein